jgi:hypothetical protein
VRSESELIRYSNAFATKNSMLLDIHNLTEEQRDAYIQTKGGGRKLLNARAILLCSIHHSIISSLYFHIHRFDSDSCVGKRKAKASAPKPRKPRPRYEHEVSDYRQSDSAEINLDIRAHMQHSNKLLSPEEIEKIPNAAVRQLELGQWKFWNRPKIQQIKTQYIKEANKAIWR